MLASRGWRRQVEELLERDLLQVSPHLQRLLAESLWGWIQDAQVRAETPPQRRRVQEFMADWRARGETVRVGGFHWNLLKDWIWARSESLQDGLQGHRVQLSRLKRAFLTFAPSDPEYQAAWVVLRAKIVRAGEVRVLSQQDRGWREWMEALATQLPAQRWRDL